MRKMIVAGAVLLLVGVMSAVVLASPSTFNHRYESSTFGVLGGEFAAGVIQNIDSSNHNVQVIIYRANGPALIQVYDSGVQSVAAGSFAELRAPDETGVLDAYSVTIYTDSDNLVPAVWAQFDGCSPSCQVPRLELHGAQLTQFKSQF